MGITDEQFNEMQRRLERNPRVARGRSVSAYQGSGEASIVESSVGHESLGSSPAKKEAPARFHIRIISVRKRLIDPDNCCIKYGVDCLRYCGLIPDDSYEDVRVQVEQRRVIPGEEEHTELIVEKL